MAHLPANGSPQHRTHDTDRSIGAEDYQYHIGKAFARYASFGPAP
jgi:hypothetical protein